MILESKLINWTIFNLIQIHRGDNIVMASNSPKTCYGSRSTWASNPLSITSGIPWQRIVDAFIHKLYMGGSNYKICRVVECGGKLDLEDQYTHLPNILWPQLIPGEICLFSFTEICKNYHLVGSSVK